MKGKATYKQIKLMEQLYKEQGKKITLNVQEWMKNLPRSEATKYIDIWIKKSRRKRAYQAIREKKYLKSINA